MAVVRLLLFLGLAVVVGALILYLLRGDRRYLRFIGQVVKLVLVLLAGVLAFFVVERIGWME